MKGLDITGENLEDLLTYDDLFLDYFNAFLGLPVFPQALAYNRLTGGFDEVFGVGTAVSGSGEVTPPYGVTDEERERMLEWAKEERLPLFMQTQLFREFKLAKLLLRPLDDRYSTSRRGSSHTVRGYSRQTESYISSLSQSGDNSANDAAHPDSDQTWSDFPPSAFIPNDAPSRAVSLPNEQFTGKVPPMNLSLLKAGNPAEDVLYKQILINRERSDVNQTDDGGPKKALREETMVSFKTIELHEDDEDRRRSKTPGSTKRPTQLPFYRGLNRAVSAPTNYREYLSFPSYNDFDMFFGLEEPEPTGQNYVLFHDVEESSEEQMETDRKNLEGRLKMGFQELKENVLGTYDGMEELKEFLSTTSGTHLLNFWLDCEYFKDSMEDSDEISNAQARNRLFRDIQDKYKMSLTKEAKDHLLKASSTSSVGLTHTIFIHTQYDVLRRLRAYWVLRFLLHLERKMKLSSSWEEKVWGQPIPAMIRHPSSMSIFPSISLVNSLPVLTEEVDSLTKYHSWEAVSRGGGHIPDRLKSAKSKLQGRLVKQTVRPLRDGLILALTADKSAGGPFHRFIVKKGDQLSLAMLLFWQDITEYGVSEDRSAERLLRLCYAWTIFRKYMAENSQHYINLSNLERDNVFQKLSRGRDFIESSVFDSAKEIVLDQLEKIWLRFLKEDLKTFLDCRFGCDEGSFPPNTASVVEITETVDNQILITRPRPWVKRYPGSTDSGRARHLQSSLSMAESMDEEKIAEKKRLARERRKEMEKERRKAIRAAKMRQKAAESKKAQSDNGDGRSQSHHDGDYTDNHPDEPKTLHFVEMAGNKQIVNIFKKYLQARDHRDLVNIVSLFMDINSYQNIGGTSKESKQKKGNQATLIHKTYLEKSGKRHIPMPEEITGKITADKDRPKTPTLKEIQSHLLTTVDESFQSFIEVQSENVGLDPQTLASMSRSEIAMRLDSDSAGMSSWNKRKGKQGKNEEKDHEEEEASPDDYLAKDDVENVVETPEKPGCKPRVRFTSESSQSGVRIERPRKTKTRAWNKVKGALKGVEAGSDISMSASVFNNRKKKKQTGRYPPSKDDKVGFLMALNQSVFGRVSVQLLYFFKYLIKHGEEDGNSLIDRDLFFYLEVQKFKECSHIFADEEMLKRKVQCIVDCFLESITPPNIQISVSAEILQKTLKAAQRYLSGKEVSSTVFDEAQYAVFKDLLPYWAGFRKSQTPQDLSRVPTTKLQKLLRKRLEAIESYQMPGRRFSLPDIAGTNMATYSFTLHEGIKCRDGGLEDMATATLGLDKREPPSRQGHLSVAPNVDGYRKRSRGGYVTTPSTAASSGGFMKSSLGVR